MKRKHPPDVLPNKNVKGLSKRKNVISFSRQYETRLAAHLEGGARNLKSPATLGRQAVSMGLTASDLAKVHELALAVATRNSSRSRVDLEKEAQSFLAEGILELKQAENSAAQTRRLWQEVNQTLHRRSSELAHSRRDLEKGIAMRKAAEKTLTSRNEHYAKLLKEAESMQERLRDSARRVLSSLEKERGQISRALQDETAQTLLGITVQLLTLQQQGSHSARKLVREIASTQELVNKTMILLRRLRRDSARHEK